MTILLRQYGLFSWVLYYEWARIMRDEIRYVHIVSIYPLNRIMV